MKKILVTGGAGYIGSITSKILVENEYEPIIFDNLFNGKKEAIPNFDLIIGDLRNYSEIESAVQKIQPDAVIHFAAMKAAGESMFIPEDYYENNVGGSANLFKALIKNNVRKLVFSSTASLYGTPQKLPIKEEDIPQTENTYGHSKLLIEEMLAWMGKLNRFDSIRLRYFNAAGAMEDGSMGEDTKVFNNVIPILLHDVCIQKKEFSLFGDDYDTPDGTCIRDYVHVMDLASAHIKALKYLENFSGSDCINIGTGQGYSLLELVSMAKKATGIDFPVNIKPRRVGDPSTVYADNSKAKEVLGWTPKYGLVDIVESAWKWHSTHPNGYQA